jgi:hypothetical protein
VNEISKYDRKNNRFYMRGGQLCVDIMRGGDTQVTKVIGDLTQNLNTGIVTLTVVREPGHLTEKGYLVSSFALEAFDVNRLVVAVMDETGGVRETYILHDPQTAPHWSFKPERGYLGNDEDQKAFDLVTLEKMAG